MRYQGEYIGEIAYCQPLQHRQ